MVWVQQVDILYTKASRGAPAASVRNRLPRAFAMHTTGAGEFFSERYTLREGADFVPSLEERGQSPWAPHGYGDLVLDASEQVVRLGLRWNYFLGQPARHNKPTAITLLKGQTAPSVITQNRPYKITSKPAI